MTPSSPFLLEGGVDTSPFLARGATGAPWGVAPGFTSLEGGVGFSGVFFLKGGGADGFPLGPDMEGAFFSSVLSDSCLSLSAGGGTAPRPEPPVGGGRAAGTKDGGSVVVPGTAALFASLGFLSLGCVGMTGRGLPAGRT